MLTSIKNKTVFLRVDYNVPHKNGKVLDATRIIASLPTIKLLLKNDCKIVIATHFGRPKGKVTKEFSVTPVVKELRKHLKGTKITQLKDSIGKEVKQKIKAGKKKQIFFLENLRFYKEEKENDTVFAHSLANLAQVYVNEAFGNCHRKHASMHAITKFLPSYPGLHLQKEIKYLKKALKPKKPVVWIMGGAKLGKIDLLKTALKKADYILIGGAIPFSFLRAMDIPVGLSKIDSDSIQVAREILKKKKWRAKIKLPIDFRVSSSLTPRAKAKVVAYNKIQNNQIGLDLGPKTEEMFKMYLRKARTIVWNGPLGMYEWNNFAHATKGIARYIAQLTALTIIGGGETADAIKKFHLSDKMSHVSTGGGAALEYLSGKKLPALEVLKI